jgi:hypothetical protein
VLQTAEWLIENNRIKLRYVVKSVHVILLKKAEDPATMVNRIAKMVLNTACVVSIALWAVSCGSGSGGSGESMLDTQLIGTWKIVSATIGGVQTTCPGTDAASGFTCGADETLTLNSDGSYSEILTSTVDDDGFWFAVNNRLMMDDTIPDDNPVSYTYLIDGNIMTAKTLSGQIAVQYARVGEPSTLTQQDILDAHPDLTKDALVDPALMGTWRYASIQYNGTTITCPGDAGIPGISCGDNEVVNFNGDNTFTETISNTTHAGGNWYALYNRVFMDDTEFEDADSSAWIYTITDNVLTLKMWGGKYTATLERLLK